MSENINQENEYYIISLKHTHKADPFITFWRPKNVGYTYCRESAGIYQGFKKGYHDLENDSLPVLVKNLEGFFLPHKYSDEGTDSHKIYNNNVNHAALGLKMTKRGLVKLKQPTTN